MNAPPVHLRGIRSRTGATMTSLSRPIATGGAALAAVALVALVDPNEPGHYPPCPLLAVTGLYCPGCGSLRALHALAHGDVATAIDRNVLAVLALPVLFGMWLHWTLRRVRGRGTRSVVAPRLLWSFAVLVMTYGVARNLPFGEWLAP